jgi:hypothetical protein
MEEISRLLFLGKYLLVENIRKENIIKTCVLTEVTKLLHSSYDRKYIIKSLLNPKSLNCKTLCTSLIEMGVREDLLTERKNKLDFFVSISNRRKGFEASDPIGTK